MSQPVHLSEPRLYRAHTFPARIAAAVVGALGVAVAALVVIPPAAAAPAPELPLFVQVDAGREVVIALTSEGEVYTWGVEDNGGLGQGTTITWSEFPRVVAFPGKSTSDPIVQVALGEDFALALSASGDVWAWGDNGARQLGIDGVSADQFVPVNIGIADYLAGSEKVIAVSAGGFHSLALTDAGRVYGWGENYWGQANYDSWADPIATPEQSEWIYEEFSDYGAKAVLIAASAGGASWAIGDDLWGVAWGFNGNGRLGIGSSSSNEDAGYIDFVGADASAEIVDIDAGDYHGIALLDDGTVWTWGDNGGGQLGIGDTAVVEMLSPTQVPSFPDLGTATIIDVAAGFTTSYAVTSDGRLYSWGDNGPNGEGALGIGVTTDSYQYSPVEIEVWPAIREGEPMVGVAGGTYIGTAITSTGGVYTWGDSAVRGDGLSGDAPAPVNVQLGTLSLDGSVAISAPPVAGTAVSAVTDEWPPAVRHTLSWSYGSGLQAQGPSFTPAAGGLGEYLMVCTEVRAENWASPIGQVCSDSSLVAAPLPSIITATLPDATAGLSYALSLAYHVTGMRSFSITAGQLPPGIQIDTEDGFFFGTSTEAGTYPFTVQVTDTVGSSTKEFTIEVSPAAPAVLDFQVSSSTVNQGGSVTFTASVADLYGNTVSDVTSDVVVTSDVATDVVSGNTVTFPHASPHTLTATWGQLMQQVVIEVTPTAGPGDGGQTGPGDGGQTGPGDGGQTGPGDGEQNGPGDGAQVAQTGFVGTAALVGAMLLVAVGLALMLIRERHSI